MSGRASLIILWGSCLLFFGFVLINLAHHPLSAETTQIDEQAHISYAMHLIRSTSWSPDFAQFHMVNPATLKPLIAENYLNHPPTFYWLMKLMSIVNPIDFRLVAGLFYAAALLLYTRIGVKLKLSLAGSILYAMLPFLLGLHLQIGFYNNDAPAMLGGLLATCASIDWFAGNRPRRAFWLMLLGVALASVKLTAFLLVGTYVLAAIALASRRSITQRDWFLAALTGLVLLVPYGMMLHLTGHLAPETIGQLQLMQHPAGNDWVRTPYAGWVQQTPMAFWQWLTTFLTNFADQMDGPEMTFIPLLLLVFAFSRLTRPTTRARSPLAFACAIATFTTLGVHIAYSWGRYRNSGWLLDSLIRYYFPLLGAYGAVCAESIRRRQT